MIDAIKKGDESAFQELFLLYRQKLYGYFYKKTKSPEDAQDLLQITFLKLWQYRQSINSSYSAEQQLFFISRTVFIDYLRKKQNHRKSVADTGLEAGVQTSDVFDMKSRLSRILNGMPRDRKQVFTLHRLYGFSYAEIAAHLSISLKSVDNHLTVALRQLKKAMAYCILPAIHIFF